MSGIPTNNKTKHVPKPPISTLKTPLDIMSGRPVVLTNDLWHAEPIPTWRTTEHAETTELDKSENNGFFRDLLWGEFHQCHMGIQLNRRNHIRESWSPNNWKQGTGSASHFYLNKNTLWIRKPETAAQHTWHPVDGRHPAPPGMYKPRK